jgi:hypothetical protein
MKAVLTEVQSKKLQALNTQDATYVECWGEKGIEVSDTDFDTIGFEKHKEMLIGFNLKWA